MAAQTRTATLPRRSSTTPAPRKARRFFDGIVRIGEFDGDMEALKRQPEGFSITIERAE